MAKGGQGLTGNFGKLSLLTILGLGSCTGRMIGDFCRECAALIVVFVPLEFFRDGKLNLDFFWHVGEGSIVLFVVGVLCEYFHLGLKRWKGDLENAWRN